jgi:hypothetical protein
MSHDDEFSLESAREASEEGRLEQWVSDFLRSPGSDNAPLADELADESLSWLGPIQIPLGDLHRLAGAEGEPVLEVVDEDDWRDDVDDMEDEIDDGWVPPPLVATYDSVNDQLVLEDGNHRAEGLRRADEEEAWTVIGFENDEQRDRFAASESA